jgi:hypothetical protein
LESVRQPRYIIPRVAGYIQVSGRRMRGANNGKFYYAGQAAPGALEIHGAMLELNRMDNSVIRYLTVRRGTKPFSTTEQSRTGPDSVNIYHASDMALDHLSLCWGYDEIFDISQGVPGINPPGEKGYAGVAGSTKFVAKNLLFFFSID